MRDTVVILINDYKLFVGDIYQGKIKPVVFRRQDYWEIFDYSDLKDFLEYMNYPLGYKNFKGSHLKIYFNQPLMYQYIYQIKEDLVQCESMEIGYLPDLILEVFKNDKHEACMIECLDKKYHIEVKEEKHFIKEVEDEETTLKVTVEQICEYITNLEDRGESVENILSRYVLFNPVTLLKEYITEEKRKYLEVDNKLLKCLNDGDHVNQGEIMLEYEQRVFKLFGRKDCKIISKYAPQSGTFISLLEELDSNKIDKDKVIGVIAPENEEREATLNWFNQCIKQY